MPCYVHTSHVDHFLFITSIALTTLALISIVATEPTSTHGLFLLESFIQVILWLHTHYWLADWLRVFRFKTDGIKIVKQQLRAAPLWRSSLRFSCAETSGRRLGLRCTVCAWQTLTVDLLLAVCQSAAFGGTQILYQPLQKEKCDVEFMIT